MKLAVWSGPRNLSTTLMRSFSSRADCQVSDEPLYAHYLKATGLDHPLRDAVLASQDQDWRAVVGRLSGPAESPLWYQKHMTHHLLPGMEGGWLDALTHVLLIRHPRAVAASYAVRRGELTADDLGVTQQAALLERLEARGHRVLVVDAADVLADPPARLERLCTDLGLAWDPQMLTWPAGPHPEDGVWGAHWYESVWRSTGFGPPTPVPEAGGPLEPLVQQLLPAWEALRLRAR